jgi:uncharacterized protein YehS (DUF1456 family)
MTYDDLLHSINAAYIRQVNDKELKYLIRQIAAECHRREHDDWMSKDENKK